MSLFVFYLIVFYAVWIYGLIYIVSMYTRTSIRQVLQTFTIPPEYIEHDSGIIINPQTPSLQQDQLQTNEQKSEEGTISNIIGILKSPSHLPSIPQVPVQSSKSPDTSIDIISPTHSSDDDDFIKI